MLNMNIITPEQLPEKSGIVFFINNAGEVTTLTASTNVAKRCNPAKMSNHQGKAMAKNVSFFMNRSQHEAKTERLMSYPESYERVVFWEMPFALADTMAKKMRKALYSRLTRFFG